MAWVKLDDQFASNPKVLESGPLGIALQVAALCYCNRHLTDGRLPRPAAAALLSFEGIGMRMWHNELFGSGEDASWQLVAEDLVAAGVWHEPGHDCEECPQISSGYYLHAYLDFQPSREQVEAEKEARSKAGKRGASARWDGRADGTGHSARHGTGHATGNGKPMANPCPVPDPVPDPERTTPPTPPQAELGTALVPASVSAAPTGAEQRIFDAWRDSTNHPRARLDDKRRKLIRSRLREYPEQDLIDAVRGWRHSPHHRGENERQTVYNDLGLLLRDAANVEKFRDLEQNPPPPQLVGSRPKSFDALQRRMAQHQAAQA